VYSVIPSNAGVIDPATGIMTWDPLFFGNATITATSTGLCGTTSMDRVVLVNAAPEAPTSGGDQTVCSDGTLTQKLTATAIAPDGSSVVWYDASAGGTVINDPAQVGVGTSTYFAESVSSTGTCPSLTRTSVTLTINAAPAAPTASDQTVCSDGTLTQKLTATAIAPDGSSVVWYNASAAGSVVPDPAQVGSGTSTYFAQSVSTTGTCPSLTRTSVTLTINAAPAAPTASDQTVCSDGTLTQKLTATAIAPDGSSVVWYNASAAGSIVTDPTQVGAGTSTYFAESVSTTGTCPSLTRTSVTLTINAAPAAPTASDQTVCSDGTLTQKLTATAIAPDGSSIVWYNASAAGTVVPDPAQVGTGTSTYFAESVSSTGTCPSLTRTSVTLTINAAPAAPTASDQTVCSDGTLTQKITATAIAPDGSSVIWYDASAAGTLVIDPTQVGIGSSTYYAESVSSTGTCRSLSRTTVTLTINALPIVTTGSYAPVCIDAADVALNGSPNGGVWTGSGVSGSQIAGYVFDPSVGTQTLTYTYTDGITSCVNTAITTISVTPNNTITLTSLPGTDGQTTVYNSAIAPINYATTGATGVTFSGLPSGVTGIFASEVVTISGSPTAIGTFPYEVILEGGCGTVKAGGYIKVDLAASTISVIGSPSFTYNGLGQGPDNNTHTGSSGLVTYEYSGMSGLGIPYSPSDIAPTNVGSYQVVATLAGDVNYNGAVSLPYPFTITKALLTVTAGNQTVPYGTPVLTVTDLGTSNTSGFVNFESPVVTGTVIYTTNYTATTPANTAGLTITPDVSGLVTENYSFTGVNGNITVSQSSEASISISVTGGSFVYDGAPHAGTGSALGVNNEVLPVNLIYNGKGSTTYGPDANAPVNAGTYTVTATFAGNNNYPAVSSQPADLTITKAGLTIIIRADNKLIYDGNRNAVINYVGFSGLAPVDNVTAGAGPGTFDNKNVGTGKLVTASVRLESTDPALLNNYSWNTIATTYADIESPIDITGSISAENKIYDGNSMAVVVATLNGVLSTDNVTLKGNATFSDRFVANGKLVTLNGPYLEGGDAINYNLTSVGTSTANITRALLTITATNQTKVYGSTFTLNSPADLSDFTADGLISPDAIYNVTLISDGAVATANVGDYPITLDGATGPGLNNYTLAYGTSGILSVTPKALTITANNMVKAYGETITFTGSEFYTAGLVNGNTVTHVTLTSAGATALASPTTYDIVPSAPVVGSDMNNYTVDFKNGTLTVGNRVLTVTVDNASRFYGADNPVFTSVITGQNPGENFTVSYSTTAVPASPVGSYSIVPTVLGATIGNYTVVPKNGTLTINRVALNITPATGQSKIYGITDPDFAYTVSPALTGGAALTGALSRAGGENAGNYAYTIGSLTAGTNYELILSTVPTFSITPKLIVITPNAGQTKVYGTTDPSFLYTAAPSLNSGDIFGGSLSRATGENVGPYAFLTGSLTAGPNYNLTIAAGPVFTITPKALTITANSRTKIYGTTITFAGNEFTTGAGELINGNYVTSVTLTSAGAAASATSGNYQIVPSAAIGSGLDNYAINYVNGLLAVSGKPTLTVTANSISRLYGAANPAFTGTVTGGLNGDVFTVTYNTPATPASVVGTYNIVPSVTGTNIGNYTVVLVNGTLTVGKAALTVTADNKFKLYRTANPPLTATITGFVNGDTRASSVTGNPSLSTSATTNSAVGTYTIRVTQGSLASSNYSFTYVNGTLTIARRATLTVTANSLNRPYGSVNPALTVTYSGFINGETFATSGINGAPNVTTSATAASLAGTYTIIPSQGTLSSTRYNFTFVNGTLTVDKAALTITANNGTKTYGTVKNFAGTEFGVTGLVNGNTVSSVSLSSTGSAATANAGTYPIVAAAATGSGLTNYTIGYVNGTLTVNPATVTITPNPGQTKVYGSLDPVFTFTHTALIGSDDVTGLMGRTFGENVGTYTFNTGTLTAGSNYTLSVASNPTFRITPLPVTVNARPQTKRRGSPDPNLTFYSNPAVGSTLANGQTISFSGTLTRVRGESVGTYPILIGSVRNSNYTISFVGANFTIVSRFGIVGTGVSSDSTTVKLTENAQVVGEIGLNVYPNPFTDHVYFDLQLQADAKVILEVYNVSGVKLATVFSEDVKALTNYKIEYAPQMVSSQILIYRLFINGKIYFTGKAIHK
jgi:hypothetical protein